MFSRICFAAELRICYQTCRRMCTGMAAPGHGGSRLLSSPLSPLMQIFVTGGTGLLGNTILRQLSDCGHRSMALVRADPPAAVFEGVATERVRGDLFDTAVIEHAVRQCDAVIHAAGVIHLGWTRHEESMRINRDGTRAVVDACIKFDRKLVHVGTVDTLAIGTRELVADEETPLDHAGGQVPCDYVLSKRAGVDEVLSGVRRGLAR